MNSWFHFLLVTLYRRPPAAISKQAMIGFTTQDRQVMDRIYRTFQDLQDESCQSCKMNTVNPVKSCKSRS
jgi:hypothetical protein